MKQTDFVTVIFYTFSCKQKVNFNVKKVCILINCLRLCLFVLFWSYTAKKKNKEEIERLNLFWFEKRNLWGVNDLMKKICGFLYWKESLKKREKERKIQKYKQITQIYDIDEICQFNQCNVCLVYCMVVLLIVCTCRFWIKGFSVRIFQPSQRPISYYISKLRWVFYNFLVCSRLLFFWVFFL